MRDELEDALSLASSMSALTEKFLAATIGNRPWVEPPDFERCERDLILFATSHTADLVRRAEELFGRL